MTVVSLEATVSKLGQRRFDCFSGAEAGLAWGSWSLWRWIAIDVNRILSSCLVVDDPGQAQPKDIVDYFMLTVLAVRSATDSQDANQVCVAQAIPSAPWTWVGVCSAEHSTSSRLHHGFSRLFRLSKGIILHRVSLGLNADVSGGAVSSGLAFAQQCCTSCEIMPQPPVIVWSALSQLCETCVEYSTSG